jgi:methionyl-tRNA synthetase
MQIRKLDPNQLSPDFGILCQPIFPRDEFPPPPFTALWNVIKPGDATKLHRHHEVEAFFIVKGEGILSVEGERSEIEIGDVIFCTPLTHHTLINRSESEDLFFINLYWEDMSQIGGAPKPKEAGRDRKRVLVFGSPPNPNGDLHLGHLAGPYLSADIYVRFRKMLGDEAYFLLGSDDNQCWTAAKAEQSGASPQETADHYAAEIQQTLARAHVEVDHFYRPNRSPHHAKLVRDFTCKLYEQGKLVAREAPALFCDSCERYLFEFYVVGNCPHCGHGTCGNACEECGRPNDCTDLIEPVCRLCGRTPRFGALRRLYFPLAEYRVVLEQYYASLEMTPQHRALCHTMLDAGLPEVVASHVTDWGLPVPFPGFEGQVVSAWLEMAPGYLAASHELSDQIGSDVGFNAFWGTEGAEVVQFFGFDNCWNHAVLYPALLKAYAPSITLPRAFVSNQLYSLDHQKFSTSRGHAIWARELLERNSVDAVRLYLAHTCPEAERTNFTLGEFDAWVESELEGCWKGWFRDARTRAENCFHGLVPEPGAWSDAHIRFFEFLKRSLAEAKSAYGAASFSPQLVVRIGAELVRRGRDFGKSESAWGSVEHSKLRTAVAMELAAIRAIAILIAPIAPDLSARLWRSLGYEMPFEQQGWEDDPRFVPVGQRLGIWEENPPSSLTP